MRRAATTSVQQSVEGTTEWSRSRLLGILVAAVVVAALILGGLVYAVVLAFSGVGSSEATTGVATGEDPVSGRPSVARGEAHRDEIAAEPMLSVPESAAYPATTSNDTPRKISVPAGLGIQGPGLVATGFPNTPEGAIGQLAQIDVAVLQSMSLQTAQEVYATWALPGGVSAEDWWITRSVQAFLSSSNMGEVKDAGATVTVEPAAALVKGTDGPDWATVCVLLKVSASYKQDGQVAFGHCERMQWVGGRWMLAPGPPAAPAPSTWPGTDYALEAGWRTWTTDHTSDHTSDHSHDTGDQH